MHRIPCNGTQSLPPKKGEDMCHQYGSRHARKRGRRAYSNWQPPGRSRCPANGGPLRGQSVGRSGCLIHGPSDQDAAQGLAGLHGPSENTERSRLANDARPAQLHTGRREGQDRRIRFRPSSCWSMKASCICPREARTAIRISSMHVIPTWREWSLTARLVYNRRCCGYRIS